MSAKVETCIKDTNNSCVDSVEKDTKIADYEQLIKGYTYLRRNPNENYLKGIKALPFRQFFDLS